MFAMAARSRFAMSDASRYRHAPRRCDLAVPPRLLAASRDAPRVFRADGRTGLSHRDAVVVLAQRSQPVTRLARASPRAGVRRFFGKKAPRTHRAVDGAGQARPRRPRWTPRTVRACCPWRTARTTPGPAPRSRPGDGRRAPSNVPRGEERPLRVRPAPCAPRVAVQGDGGGRRIETRSRVRAVRAFSPATPTPCGMDTWARRALSIMGKRQFQNCPFGNGNGYGDGRAVSVGEVLGSRAGDGFVNPTTQQRWEMQLKGGGPTPFCRGADGRAVLRSSIREFLASEAMFHLGVDTTRALSLVVSQEPGDVVRRPWYDPAAASSPRRRSRWTTRGSRGSRTR